MIFITKCENDNLHELLFTSAENITKYFMSTRKMEKGIKLSIKKGKGNRGNLACAAPCLLFMLRTNPPTQAALYPFPF